MSNSNKQEDKEEHQQDSSIDKDRIIAQLIQVLANEMYGKEVIAKVILEQNLLRLSDWDNLELQEDYQAFIAPFAKPTVYASIVLELIDFCGMKSRIKDKKKLHTLIVRLLTSSLIPKFSILVSHGKKKMIEFCEDVLIYYDREYGLVVISDDEKKSNSNKKKNSKKKNTNKKVKHTVTNEVVIKVPSNESDVVASYESDDEVKLQEEKVVSPNQSYDSNKISQKLQEHFEQKQNSINEFNSVKSDVDRFKAETSRYFAEHPSRPDGEPRLPDTLNLKIKKQTEMLLDVLIEKLDARISILETGLTKLVVELRKEGAELREEVVILRKEAEGQTNTNLLLTNLIQQLTTKSVEQTNLIQQLTTKAVEQTNLIQQQTNFIQQLTKKFDEQVTAHEKEKILQVEQYKKLEERISRMMTTCNCGCSNCLNCVNKQ